MSEPRVTTYETGPGIDMTGPFERRATVVVDQALTALRQALRDRKLTEGQRDALLEIIEEYGP